jgi:hypothetical protein
MAAPQNRVPVRVARGTKANLDAALALSSLQEGELCYAKDQNILYVVESSTLIGASYSPSGTSIDALADVDTSTVAPSNGQFLRWNSTTNRWEPQTNDSRILQVVQTVKTDVFSGSANNTPLAVTGLSATITPNSVSNKILIMAQISYASTGVTFGGWFRRGAIDIGRGDLRGSRQRVGMGLGLPYDGNQINTFSYSFLDSPATNLPVTYQYYVIGDNANTFYVNRSNSDADSVTGKCATSTVTLIEVAS